MTYLDVFFPSSYLVERKQSALSGRAKRRAENIINLPYEAKIINHLVTTERLKEYGFLSDAVGDICPYQDFYGERPIKRKAKEVEELETNLMIRARLTLVIFLSLSLFVYLLLALYILIVFYCAC